MRFVLVLLSLLTTAIPGRAQDRVSFYFAAHEDDWQLFMNPNAYHDVRRESSRVVFVYLTAGDAGAGLGKGGRSQPYYLARENGAKTSVRFTVDVDSAPQIPVESVGSFAGHPIMRWIYGNTVSYFFRLPDGNPEGTGYETTGMQSLRRLHEGSIAEITPIDSSTSYRGWSDLVATLRAIIDHEREAAPDVWINVPDTDLARNIGDHADHQHMAQGVLEAIEDLPCINRGLFLNYVTETMPDNLEMAEREIEIGTFGALVAGVTALDHGSPFDGLHRAWLSRHYQRVEPGSGPCTP